MTEPAMFAIPAGPAVQLDVAARLASWNRAGGPDQMKLEAFLAATEQLLRPRCEQRPERQKRTFTRGRRCIKIQIDRLRAAITWRPTTRSPV